MADAIRSGIHRRTLYAMRDAGQVEVLARGLYRLADAPPLGNPDLVTVAAKIPHGVVYLLSALAFHEMTTQIPHEVCIAVPRNSEPPHLDHPPIRAVRLSQAPYEVGIERHQLDGVTVKVYSREKTLADCFKHRNEIGLDTVLEAVRMYKAQGRVNADAILRFAAVCRVARIARPYLESLL
jgi:predicted transcriptional regulator of viral defense system